MSSNSRTNSSNNNVTAAISNHEFSANFNPPPSVDSSFFHAPSNSSSTSVSHNNHHQNKQSSTEDHHNQIRVSKPAAAAHSHFSSSFIPPHRAKISTTSAKYSQGRAPSSSSATGGADCVNGMSALNNSPVRMLISSISVIGKGTFGSIEKASIVCQPITNNADLHSLSASASSPSPSHSSIKITAAIKKVHQDPRYKNRELNILQQIGSHPNIVAFLYYYYTGNHTHQQTSHSSNNVSSSNVSSSTAAHNRNANSSSVASSSCSSSAAASLNTNVYLHIVMECFPESLCELISRYNNAHLHAHPHAHSQHHSSQQHASLHGNCPACCPPSSSLTCSLAAAAGGGGAALPIPLIKIFTYQIARALAYIHAFGICHRDIKSSNLLVNERTAQLKLCDFGSAKELAPGSPSVSYISSRYYRAPELLLGARIYSPAIDIWSAGCVLGEMLHRTCLFMGVDTLDQLHKIIRVLGTPHQDDMLAMNPALAAATAGGEAGRSGTVIGPGGHRLPNIVACPIKLYFARATPSDMLDLLQRMLTYSPMKRIRAAALLQHASFTTPTNRSALIDELFQLTDRFLQTAVPAVTTASNASAVCACGGAAALRNQRDRHLQTVFELTEQEEAASKAAEGGVTAVGEGGGRRVSNSEKSGEFMRSDFGNMKI